MTTAIERRRREWVYVACPNQLGVGPCSRCDGQKIDWSTYRELVWCWDCCDDVRPTHWGILDGPVPMEVCQMMGISFDAFDLLTHGVVLFGSELWPDKIFT